MKVPCLFWLCSAICSWFGCKCFAPFSQCCFTGEFWGFCWSSFSVKNKLSTAFNVTGSLFWSDFQPSEQNIHSSQRNMRLQIISRKWHVPLLCLWNVLDDITKQGTNTPCCFLTHTVRRWETGKTSPNWFRNSVHTLAQLRSTYNDNNLKQLIKFT